MRLLKGLFSEEKYMGLFDGIKSLKAIKDIRNGKTASLSYSR